MELFPSALYFCENVVGLGSPDKRRRILIVLCEVLLQSGNEIGYAMEDATPKSLGCEITKKPGHSPDASEFRPW